jgi:hypothetical protein
METKSMVMVQTWSVKLAGANHIWLLVMRNTRSLGQPIWTFSTWRRALL